MLSFQKMARYIVRDESKSTNTNTVGSSHTVVYP